MGQLPLQNPIVRAVCPILLFLGRKKLQKFETFVELVFPAFELEASGDSVGNFDRPKWLLNVLQQPLKRSQKVAQKWPRKLGPFETKSSTRPFSSPVCRSSVAALHLIPCR